MNFEQHPQQNPVDLTLTTPISCESCGNTTFKEGMLVRKESRFASGLPDDRIVPIALILCSKCETPLDEFVPLPLKAILKSEMEKDVL